MRIGTKSVLIGAHCFFIHPFFVAAAWWRLFGFPNKIQYWVAFFVHDIGYLGKPNIDGEEGERHPEFGAKIMHWLFDKRFTNIAGSSYRPKIWYNFCYYHSRFLAKQDNMPFSKLCVADKLAIVLEPTWFYLLRVNLTGEVREYMKHAENGRYVTMRIPTSSKRRWFEGVKSYLRKWVEEHKEGKNDTWTPNVKQAINSQGVWK